jgi:hypothetical protein
VLVGDKAVVVDVSDAIFWLVFEVECFFLLFVFLENITLDLLQLRRAGSLWSSTGVTLVVSLRLK